MAADITVAGRVYSEPELKTFGKRTVCQFKLSNSKKDKKTDQWISNIFRVTVWEGGEEVLPLINKGDRLVVSGRFWMDTYKSQDGVEHSVLDIGCNADGLSKPGEQDELPSF